jgi:hypothetical protein
MCSCWRSVTGPAQRSDGSGRGCPLGTVIDPPIWHAGGAATRTCGSRSRPTQSHCAGCARGEGSWLKRPRYQPTVGADMAWHQHSPLGIGQIVTGRGRHRGHEASCSLQPPMNDRCLDPHTIARFVGQVLVSPVGGSWSYGWNRSAVSCGTYLTCSRRARRHALLTKRLRQLIG